MRSEGSFKDFLLGGKTLSRVLVLLLVGVMLILIGSLFGTEKKTEQASAPTAEESLAEICSLTEGVGRCRVMMSFGDEGEVEAVAVLCEGAENDGVRARVVRLVGSLYGIGSNRISVLKISE